MNTPSAHRVHHASNVNYLDANYGGVLIIFDRLFGTYIPERDDEKPIYGWVRPMQSHNPFVIVFRPWIDLARDLRNARSLRDVAGYLFAPPGWQPDGKGRQRRICGGDLWHRMRMLVRSEQHAILLNNECEGAPRSQSAANSL